MHIQNNNTRTLQLSSSTPTFENIHNNLFNEGYYLANIGHTTPSELLDLLYQFGEPWHPDYPVMTVAPVEGGQFVAQLDCAIPPHNECAYDHNPPRLLALYCEENKVDSGDFYLLEGQEILDQFTPAQYQSLQQTIFNCDMGQGFSIDTPLVRTLPSGKKQLIYTTIGNTPNWQSSHYYSLKQAYDEYSDSLIQILNYHLQQENFRLKHKWTKGDLLIFDNLRFMHGRDVFEGNERVLHHIRLR